MNEDYDYTGRICPLFPSQIDSEWPMYSYERPAYTFWNGFANGLKKQGFTDKEIGEWLMSKQARWMLDGKEHELSDLGFELSQGAKKVE